MDKLKLCPFCGGSAYLFEAKKHKKFPYYVKCATLTCSCRTERWNTATGAIKAWNRRAANERTD